MKCSKCGYEGPAIDQHHVYGRKDDPDTTVPLCANCHREHHTPILRDARNGSWFWIQNEIFRGGWGKEIGPNGIAIYAALALHANNKTQKSFPSHDTIAALCGMSRPTVIKYVRLLEQYNLISIEQRDGKVNQYWLNDIEEWRPVTSKNDLPVNEVDTPVNEVDTRTRLKNKD